MGDPLEPLLADPRRTAVLTDFDGTLSPIVDDPSAAAPLPGALDVLTRLARRFAKVGVISGRPVDYLVSHLGRELWLSGLYGLETLEGGEIRESEEGVRWRPVVADAVARARADLDAVVESKGLSLTLHFRTRPELADAVRRWAEEEAARSGLAVRTAKASVELHPPVHADKGTVVEAAAAGMAAACFLGDDVGDLPAFDGLDRLAANGLHVVRVGVRTSEAPPELLARADVVVDGPEGALAVLELLAGI